MKNNPLIIAHRGFSANYPENTLIAFSEAINSGAQMIEFDVHLSKDKELVVTHDYKLGRTVDAHGEIDSYTLSELQVYDCGSWFDKKFSDQKMPSLKDVLLLVNKRVKLNIELKPESLKSSEDLNTMVTKLLDLILKMDYRSSVVISSFDKSILKKIRSIDDSILLGVLDHTPHIKLKLKLAREIKAYSYHPNFVRLNQAMIELLNENELLIFPYTANSSDDFQKLVELGVDGIITNEVLKLKLHLNQS